MRGNRPKQAPAWPTTPQLVAALVCVTALVTWQRSYVLGWGAAAEEVCGGAISGGLAGMWFMVKIYPHYAALPPRRDWTEPRTFEVFQIGSDRAPTSITAANSIEAAEQWAALTVVPPPTPERRAFIRIHLIDGTERFYTVHYLRDGTYTVTATAT